MNASIPEPAVAFVAVGSNIDPERNILNALDSLRRVVDVRATSSFYRTPPVARPEQPAFINGVWKILACQNARALKFDVLRRVEDGLGRTRTKDSHASRTIDLDLILFGDRVVEEPGLSIPDRDIYERSFVAIPLMELVPDLKLPDSKKPLSSLSSIRLGEGLEPLPEFTEQLKQRLKQ